MTKLSVDQWIRKAAMITPAGQYGAAPGSNDDCGCSNCDRFPEVLALARSLSGPPVPREPGWSTCKRTIRAHQLAADAFLLNLAPYPEGKFSARGITIAAGGKYWASAYVTVRMIRHVGCALPIQIWYLGASGERDERYERLLAPFGVEFVDIDTHPARAGRRIVSGFGTKLFAVMHSPFEEVLSLDPDNYPCADPTRLFDLPEYKRLGGIYWPDGGHTDGWTHFDRAGCKRRGPCGLETGMYVVNKRTAWEPLSLAEWYDDHADWAHGGFAGEPGLDYGDKVVRVAWAKLERDYVIFTPHVRWEQFAFVQVGPDAKTPMFVHRCRNKWHIEGDRKYPTTPQVGEPNARANLPGEEAAFGFLDELRRGLAAF